MIAAYQTAYPRLRKSYSQEDLRKLYTPTEAEYQFVLEHTNEHRNQLCLLTLLKVFQYLGYFPSWSQVPKEIIEHIAKSIGCLFLPSIPLTYDRSGNRNRHVQKIRAYLGVKPLGPKTYRAMGEAANKAAEHKEHLADIINAVLEELIRQCFELPAFSRLLRSAKTARKAVNENCFKKIGQMLSKEQKEQIEAWLSTQSEDSGSWWNQLKEESAAPSLNIVRSYVKYIHKLEEINKSIEIELELPPAKRQQFFYEAYAIEWSKVKRLAPNKKYTLVLVLMQTQMGKAIDNLAYMFIRQMQELHSKSKKLLDEYHDNSRKQVGVLVKHLENITSAYQSPGTELERFVAIADVMPPDPDQVIEECQEHLAYVENNYLLCLPLKYKSKRAEKSSLGKLDWMTKRWHKLVTGKRKNKGKITKIHRKYFELCVFSQLMDQLKSGDIFIKGAIEYDDYRTHLISWEEYKTEIALFHKLSGIPIDSALFVEKLKKEMLEATIKTNDSFPSNKYARMENGELIMPKGPKKLKHEYYEIIDKELNKRLRQKQVSILDILIDTEKWLGLSQYFHTLSGTKSRTEDYSKRLITTLFCYGSFLGPSEAARSVVGSSRKQIAWLNAQHITAQRLDRANTKVINAYNQFRLPKCWGSGKSASADGTHWDLREQNLMAEYHIRYGGYGGIGYYHISDTYIALFSRFIPCGVHEAIYILDGLIKNESDIQPDTLHGDSHSQSTVVFGLAYLLGIKLMPRIKNLKNLVFFQADKNQSFEHIDELFTEKINWKLIEKHLPDMLRVVLSIKAGKIAPSTILRRLGTYSRKNKLYFAFRELGRAVRTIFSMQYIEDVNLRKTIQAATTVSESFNNFAAWLAFANKGIIPQNLKHEQIKMVKYNHLMANLVILYNVNRMTEIFNQLSDEGYPIDKDLLKDFAPYHTAHINRFGSYPLNMSRKMQPLTHYLKFRS